jgi:hypothetical protein
MKRLLLAVILILSISCAPDPRAPAFDVTVRATNPAGHAATPVSAIIDLPAGTEGPVCIRGEGVEIPGQVEPLPDGRAHIWWTVDLPAGATGRYTLDLGSDCSDGAFSWAPAKNETTDLFFQDWPVLQYVHPTFDPENIEHSKKPFHHVYDPQGRRHITKGAGGLYSHHRGIFFGYNHIYVGDSEERLDTWHANNGEHQRHVENLATHEGPVFGGHAARILWNDLEGKAFAEEVREIRAFRQPDREILIDFRSSLRTLVGPVRLDGDRQHAGIQFRASQDVAENLEATRFLRPADWADRPEDQEVNDESHVDLPWNAMRFPLNGQLYTVAYLSHPSNPRDAEMSERRYGRFGEFFRYSLDRDRPLSVHYRFWIVEGPEVTREDVERRFQDLAQPPVASP